MLQAAQGGIPKRLLSGQEVEVVSQETVEAMNLAVHKHGFVRILPEGWLYLGTAPTFLNNMYMQKFRPEDVVVVGFSKSGTTWLQEILWTMTHNANFDNPKAGQPIWLRSPTISLDIIFDPKAMDSMTMASCVKIFDQLCPEKKKEDGMYLQLAEVTPSPRIFKNNYPLSLQPPDILDNAKVVYVARNPKDVIVSFFHFFKMLNVNPNAGNFEEYCKAFITDKAMNCPYWPHVKEAWQKRQHPNMHFVLYENLKSNIMLELEKLNGFLGTRLTREKLEDVANFTSFSALKSRGEPAGDKFFRKSKEDDVKFFRKGIVGDWKNEFAPELQREVDQWIKDNLDGWDFNTSWAYGE